MRVRTMVGHRVSRVADTVRPTKPKMFTAWWDRSNRECHGSARSRARIAPKIAPTGRKNAATAYHRTVMPNRAGRAVRNWDSKDRPCHVSSPPMIVADTSVSHHQFASMPTISRTVPAVTP